jgi:hypothetical protein
MGISHYLIAAMILGLKGTATPPHASTVEICKTRCEKNAEINRTACSELPPNLSCLHTAQELLRQCHAYCEHEKPGPPPPKSFGECDPDLQRCR